MEKVRIGKAHFDNVTKVECLACIRSLLAEKTKGFFVTANVDNVMILERDAGFRAAYRDARLVLADGAPVIWASRLFRTPLKEKASGSDLVPLISRMSAAEGYRLFFLGAGEGVAKKAADRLAREIPGLRIAGTACPAPGFENRKDENRRVIEAINRAAPDILFVALGAPKQEKWIHAHLEDLRIGVALGIGASLDFIAGTKKRAPLFFQKTGLEWFWRFALEPRRLFRRYFVDDLVPFTVLVLKQRLAGKS
jgi:N-acetylglucosaminyldiphosphoundecaprenol N-acetyl-beta-D-mannosaminyltransferase